MTEYVLGFLFRPSWVEGQQVALIYKKRPDWQRGKLNGVGGHIEAGETPLDAMVREFNEEAGVVVTTWEPFCVMRSSRFRVHCFRAAGIRGIYSVTDEEVGWYQVPEVFSFGNLIPNLRWLIPLAQDREGVTGVMQYHDLPGDGNG